MPWFKIDDGFHGHPKVMDLDTADVGLWTLAGTWCAQYLTDGRISMVVVRRLGGTEANCAALVGAGMWIDNGDGSFQFKDWDDYQPLKADVEAEREQSRERMRKVRAKRKGTTSGRSEDVRANTERSSDEVREKFALPRPSPTQPDPARPEPSPIGEGGTPTPFCSKHPFGTDDPCRACGDARKAWKAAGEPVTPPPPSMPNRGEPECAHHPGYPMPCTRCAEEREEAAA